MREHSPIKTTSKPKLNLLRIQEDLSAAHLRLARTTIENLTWQQILKKYDREHTLFYLDPPYYECEDYYGKGIFERKEFEEIAKAMKTIKGKVCFVFERQATSQRIISRL